MKDAAGGHAKRTLREGFTTGAAAAAAAAAALASLLGEDVPSGVDVPMVEAGRMCILVEGLRREGEGVRATVVKDAGDDPDATHGARVSAVAEFEARRGVRGVAIEGGRGVGRATLPGLPVPVGEAAINPGPRTQIRRAVLEVMDRRGAEGEARILVEVERGEALARKTMNPRLGVIGGISILGTTGVVRPLSHDAWRACVAQGLDVAAALGLEEVCLATGRRSERLFLERRPELPEQGAVQAGDHFAFALRAAAERGIRRVWWSVFFGKLVKQAMGLESTHARDGRLDLGWLADRAREAGAAGEHVAAIRGANTAREALDVVRTDPGFAHLLEGLSSAWFASARGFAGGGPALGLAVFDLEGRVLIERREEKGEPA